MKGKHEPENAGALTQTPEGRAFIRAYGLLGAAFGLWTMMAHVLNAESPPNRDNQHMVLTRMQHYLRFVVQVSEWEAGDAPCMCPDHRLERGEIGEAEYEILSKWTFDTPYPSADMEASKILDRNISAIEEIISRPPKTKRTKKDKKE